MFFLLTIEPLALAFQALQGHNNIYRHVDTSVSAGITSLKSFIAGISVMALAAFFESGCLMEIKWLIPKVCAAQQHFCGSSWATC